MILTFIILAAAAEGADPTQAVNQAINLKQLRTSTGPDLRRMLVTLHGRWGHASAGNTHRILGEYPGLSGEVKSLCESVVRDCVHCRETERPARPPAVAHREPLAFGHTVSADLAFRENLVFLALVDHAALYTVAAVVNSRTPEDVWPALFHGRITPVRRSN